MTSPSTHVAKTRAPEDALETTTLRPRGSKCGPHGRHGSIPNTGSVPFSTLRRGTLESPGCDHNTQNLGRIPETGADPGAAHLLWGAGRRRRQPRAQSPRAYPEPAPQAREQRRRGRHLALTLSGPAHLLALSRPCQGLRPMESLR